MALKLKQTGLHPLGQFDGYDTDYLTILGGELGFLAQVAYKFPGSADRAAADVFDGYGGYGIISGGAFTRPAVSHTFPVSSAKISPLFLLDEGQIGYGTMFGYVVGGAVGQVVPNPMNITTANTTVLGPSTALASGKVTCWDKPGLYSVTLDAVDPAIVPQNLAAGTGANAQPGDPVYAMSTGKLTLTSGSSWNTPTASVVGRFVEFCSNGSLVTSTTYQAGPTYGNTSTIRKFTEMVISFRIE